MKEKLRIVICVFACASMVLATGCGAATQTPATVEPTNAVGPTSAVAPPTTEPTQAGTPISATGQVQYWASPAAYKAATGNDVGTYKESPFLQGKVATGELPAVDKRLPEEPLVLMPADQIGVFGGTLRDGDRGRLGFLEDLLNEFPLNYSSDMQSIVPNIFQSYDVSADSKVFTFKLRKGMKWSDGEAFTTGDFMYWYEDIALNKDLNPSGIPEITVNGQMGVFEAIDDYTLRVTFSAPDGVFLEYLCRFRPVPYAPAHYMKQFDPKYTPQAELDQKAKDAGFSSWVDLFNDAVYFYNNPNTPTVSPWIALNRNSDPVQLFERNPYYWKVDINGNQLPYIDGVNRPNYGNLDNIVLEALAGNFDQLHPFFMNYAENYSLMKANEVKGDYKLVPEIGWSDNWAAIVFNFSSKDPVWRTIFGDIRFREALSFAINRKEINDTLFLGLAGTPSSPAPPDGPPYNGEGAGFMKYAAFDPNQANQLLDAMGLNWNADHTVRLRPDGKPLEAVMTVLSTGPGNPVQITELYKTYFATVGFNISLKPIDASLFSQVLQSGDYDLGAVAVNWGGRRPIITGLYPDPLPLDGSWVVDPAWGLWITSGGTKGDEPPEAVKQLYALHQAFVAEPDAQKRIAIENQIFQIHNDNLWIIASVKKQADSIQDYYHLISNRLTNIPIPVPPETPYMVPSSWTIKTP